MEKIIIISLILIVILSLKDRGILNKKAEKQSIISKANPTLPDIMGQPKAQPVFSTSKKTAQTEIIKSTPQINPEDLDIEYDENETLYRQIPKEELDKAFTNSPNLEEEEEEWYQYHISHTDNGFAQGVTFEELGTVNTLLLKEDLNQDQKDKAIDIVKRLQGTELFSLLENSIEGVSIKIAKLLDNSLFSDSNNYSSTIHKNNLNDFDIGEFI
ncbi:MAG: conjugal transfer protein TraD [Myroides sp.]|uniref:conjugal transfer protein TraD n=1 Tax=Flavobacterium sp. TaxID=239 RepID=UPI002FCA8D86